MVVVVEGRDKQRRAIGRYYDLLPSSTLQIHELFKSADTWAILL